MKSTKNDDCGCGVSKADLERGYTKVSSGPKTETSDEEHKETMAEMNGAPDDHDADD